jgi:hypothetical protein
MKELALIQDIPAARPRLHLYRYPIAGDDVVSMVEMVAVPSQ